VAARGANDDACEAAWQGLVDAAEVLVLLEPALAALERQASLALERAPTGAG
jgi:hypothetical protein